MSEAKIIEKSFSDFFSKDILKIAFIPLFGTLAFMFIFFMGAADYTMASLDEIIVQAQNGENITIDPNAPFYYSWVVSILNMLLQYSLTAWLAGFLLYTFGIIFILYFSIFVTLLIIGFLTPMIIEIIRKKDYPIYELHGFGSFFAPLYVALKSFVVMVILFIVLIPLYFIPLVNLFAINLPLYYFFHKLLNFDVASTMLSNDEYKEIRRNSKGKFRLRTLGLYFVSMIPFITLFSTVFYIVYLTNAYFIELEKVSNNRIER